MQQRRDAVDAGADAVWVRAQLGAFDLADVLDTDLSQLPRFLLDRGRLMKAWDLPRRNAAVATIEEVAARVAADAPRPFMNWTEIRDMAAHGIEIGNHTLNHPILSELPDAAIADEVNGASAEIASMLGQAPKHLAYPYGKHDERVRQSVRSAGIHGACSTSRGLVAQGDDTFALNRINMCSDIAPNRLLFALRILLR